MKLDYTKIREDVWEDFLEWRRINNKDYLNDEFEYVYGCVTVGGYLESKGIIILQPANQCYDVHDFIHREALSCHDNPQDALIAAFNEVVL